MSRPTKVNQAIEAWRLSAHADEWTRSIDTILITKWRGSDLAWPLFDCESFDIIRIDDSSIVAHAELETCEALALEWQCHKLCPPVTWGTA
jgi:hypothetical protein